MAVQGDFYFNGCWQALARQAEGSKSGSGGQVTHRAAAVHRLVLWAGGLSTAGALSDLLEIRAFSPKPSETTHRFPGRARKVSKVAENLGLGQPAVSNALARLRKLFGDELFLRTSSGMQPTPFADQLAESIGYALGMIHGAINARNSFDPATSKRRFSVGMTDIGEIYFLPLLMEKLQKLAPAVSISTIRNTTINLKDAMEAGHIDLAVGLLPQLKAGFFQRRLFTQQYVCMFRQGHPLDRKKILPSDFFAADHVTIVSAGTGHGMVDEILDKNSPQRTVRLTVPHFVAVGHILQSTNLVATVPERFAERMATPFGLKYVPHPVKLPQIAINLFWHAKYHKDPANQWLRGLLFEMHADK